MLKPMTVYDMIVKYKLYTSKGDIKGVIEIHII